ncbi:MAG: PF20097 family protein [Candidatus Hermodarchaeota archaeon]
MDCPSCGEVMEKGYLTWETFYGTQWKEIPSFFVPGKQLTSTSGPGLRNPRISGYLCQSCKLLKYED